MSDLALANRRKVEAIDKEIDFLTRFLPFATKKERESKLKEIDALLDKRNEVTNGR